MKLLIARRRPDSPPRLRHMPRASSFPSGHSASAFAFALAASRELPQAGAVLFPLAAGVSYSRVYLGVHYPAMSSRVRRGPAAIPTATPNPLEAIEPRRMISRRCVDPRRSSYRG
jgi:PAP2 superfamily